jgi:hypothetical protein
MRKRTQATLLATAFGLGGAATHAHPIRAAQAASTPAKPTPRKPAPAPAVTPPPGFQVEIEQGGRKVRIDDHRARIARGPFDLVVDASPAAWPYVHASYESKVYDAARAGRPLGGTFKSIYVVAEALKMQDLSIGDGHRVQYFSDDAQPARFDDIKKVGSRSRGRRTVKTLVRDHGREPIETTEEPVLYLVLVRGPADAKTYEVADEQREYLALELGDPPPGFEKGLEPNPEYAGWAGFKKGSWVENKSDLAGLEMVERLTLDSVTPRAILLKKYSVVLTRWSESRQRVFPKRRIGFAGKTTDSPTTLLIKGKTLACTQQRSQYMDRWICPEVPGGVARQDLKSKGGAAITQSLVTDFKVKK